MNIFFIDYETTGLNPYHDEPIEIAIKKIDEDNYYSSLIKPTFNGLHYGYIPPKINKLTGISDKDIENNSKKYHDVTFDVIQYIKENSEEGPIYIVAHNGTTFDFIFFRKAIDNYNKEGGAGIQTRSSSLNMEIIQRFRYIDTLLMAKLLIKSDSVRQSNLCRMYNITNQSEHRSLGDVTSLEQIYKVICEHLSYLHRKEKDYYRMNPLEIISKTYY